MKTYSRRGSSEVLERRKIKRPNEAYTFEFRSNRGAGIVATIYFRINRAASELELFTIGVSGHSNAATATGNPHPGLGRLLVYLACKFAEKQGVRKVRLAAVASAMGFYVRMGFHRSSASNPVGLPGPFEGGELSASWTTAFNRNFARTRIGGFLQAEIATVLRNITAQTEAEWEERKDGVCTIM